MNDMIAIPNIEKPKTCHECRLHSYDWGNEYILSHDVCHPLGRCFNSPQYDGGRQIDTLNEVRPDCPLIEIAEPTETLIHDIRKLIAFIEPHMIIASTYDEQIERAKAVKDWLLSIVGERRTDEGITE